LARRDAALETFLRDWQPANPGDLRANLEAKA
jgi:hypothetical protein